MRSIIWKKVSGMQPILIFVVTFALLFFARLASDESNVAAQGVANPSKESGPMTVTHGTVLHKDNENPSVTPGVGSVVRARFDLSAQSTPPNFFGHTGPSVGVVKPNEPYIIIQEKSYPSLTGDTQKWFQVAPLPNNQTQTTPVNHLWIYYGREGSSPGNLVPCDAACVRGKNGPDG
jgi:hypothetical protein